MKKILLLEKGVRMVMGMQQGGKQVSVLTLKR